MSCKQFKTFTFNMRVKIELIKLFNVMIYKCKVSTATTTTTLNKIKNNKRN